MTLKKYKISFDSAMTYEFIVMATDEDHAEEVLEQFEENHDVSDAQTQAKLLKEGKENPKAEVVLDSVDHAFSDIKSETFEIEEYVL